MKVKVDLDFLVNNQICLIIFVLHGKWRSIGGEGPGRVPGVRGCLVCAVASSLTVGGSAIWDSDWLDLVLIGSISPLDWLTS